jgi:hypothetical protein
MVPAHPAAWIMEVEKKLHETYVSAGNGFSSPCGKM